MKPKKKYKESKIKAAEAARQQRPSPTPCSSSSSSNRVEESVEPNDGESFRPDENKSYAIQSETSVKQENNSETEVNVASKKYSKREIFSNWEHWKRYDELQRSCEEQEEEESQGLNFQQLLAAPMSAGGHFMFKSEKLEAPASAGNLFALDLEALSQGLSTIPFYRQLELPTSYFSDEEIQSMDKKAARVNTKINNLVLSLLMEETKQDEQLTAKKAKEINNVLISEDKINLSTTSNVQVSKQMPISKPVEPVSLQSTSIQSIAAESSSIELPSVETLSIQSSPAQLPLLDTSSTNTASASDSNPPYIQTLAEASKGQREKRSKKPERSNAAQELPDNKNKVECEQFVDSIPDIVETNIQPPEVPSSIAVVKPDDDLEAWLDSVLDD